MIFKLLMIGVALLVAGAISLEAAPELPVVTIEAIDAVGSEDGDTITFRLSRKGDTTNDLAVRIVFLFSSGFVSPSEVNFTPPSSGAGFIIPAGSGFLDILVIPVDDDLVEGDETLRLTVNPSDNYEVGDPAVADAIVVDRNDADPPIAEPDSTPAPISEIPPVPLCNHIGDPEDAVVRAHAPDNAVTDGAVYCRILNENGTFRGDIGQVGDPDLIEQGILQAVDVFGLTVAGDPVTRFNVPVYVCLRGSGDLFYADATYAPRVYVQIAGSISDDFTCAAIPNAGTLVLARHESTLSEA